VLANKTVSTQDKRYKQIDYLLKHYTIHLQRTVPKFSKICPCCHAYPGSRWQVWPICCIIRNRESL